MEESETDKNKLYLQILHQDGLREDCGKELRTMELQAYSNVMDVMRAEGTLDKEKKGVIDSLRKYFNISEARHIAECRRVNSNNKLLEMADRLQIGFDSEAADETWTVESYGTFPPLPSLQRRTSGYSRTSFSRTILPVAGPIDELHDIVKTEGNVESFKSISDDVAALAEFKWHSKVKKVNKKVQTKVSTIHRNGIAGGSSDESDVKNERERSPDIIDAGSPLKKTSPRRGVVTKTTRGPKRKASMEQLVDTNPGSRRLSNVETTRSATASTTAASSARITKKMKFNKGFAKTKGKFPKIKFVKRPRDPSPELSTDDEDNHRHHRHHHQGVINKDDHPRALVGLGPSSSAINNTVESPTIRITSPPMRPVTTTTSRGRGSRMRGRGMFSRGRGRGGRGGHALSSPNLGFIPNRNDLAAGGSPPRHVMPISSPSKRSPSTSPTKPLKASKPKKPKPVSLSRRKSRLKEKEDDDMQVEWNDYDDDALIISNKHFPIIKKRKLHPDELSHSDDGDMMENPLLRNHHGKIHLENGEAHNSKQIGGYVPHGYHHQHPHYHQNYLSPPNDHHHHVGGRDGSHLRSPQLSGEETDSASEKGSITGGSRTNESPGTNSSNANSPPPPPSRQKQRLKSPFNPSPQLPRINIPPPIFSTSLSSVQKKRPQKHISVVDSLNLHLPTTPTASSLASSARRESMPTGSSIFSNQAIQLSRNAGGSPGILQTQRKATPHILSNSKTIQRTYVPTTSSTPSGVINSGGGMCVSVGGTTINLSTSNPITSISSTAGGTTGVQVQTSVNIPNVISTSSGIIQIPNSSPATIPMQMGTTTATARPPGSSPIILVQKTNPNSNAPAAAIQLQSNAMASKTGSRAVILRRTTQPQQQLPRSQGNVMFLDVQNKQVTNQIHPFLQPVSRILTAPSEMSVLNIQSGQPQRTLIQSSSPDQHHEPTVVFKSVATPSMSHRKQKLVGSEVVFTTIPNHVQPGATIRIGQNDTQMAQIEAELLEMEQEIAYEEEVETSESANNSVELPHQSIQFTIPTRNSASHSAISSTSVSGNSSAEANTYSTAGSVASNSTVKIINATYGGIPGDNNAQNHNSQNMVANHEDIFSTALKSSGIVFTDQQFFDVEEICESNDTQQQQNSVDVINHIMLGSQENGSKQ